VTTTDLATGLLNGLALQPADERHLVGITGCPAAGKSTLALSLAREVNHIAGAEIAAVVPMDGFHLPNDILESRGIRHLKGVPETFDPEAFGQLLRRLRRETRSTVLCPEYSRVLHAAVSGAISIRPNHRVLVVEGNYLLLDTGRWSDIRPLLNEVWYVEVDDGRMRERLLERHIAGGRTLEQAVAKMEETDIPNAEMVRARAHSADRIIRLVA
jgi:pantothenate kinase